MIYFMAGALFAGVLFGATVTLRVLAPVVIAWLSALLILYWFISATAIINWLIAAAIFQAGYVLGMIIRAMLEAKGCAILGLVRRGSKYRSAPKKDGP